MSEEAGGFWAEEAMAPELSQSEKKLRDKFADEYIIDFDQTAAAIRIGFSASFAASYAQQFMEEPYVRQRISQLTSALAEDAKTEAEETKRRIRAALLREAHYRGPGSSHAARVSALGQLKSLYGMDAPSKTVNTHLHRGGVMQVPEIANLEEWEKAASESQEKLRKESEV